ncbi:MAG TPA: DUF2064 domain-containing protein [Myxococcota bacterium]
METLILFASTTTPARARVNDAVRARSARLSTGFLEDTARLCARWQKERAGVDQNRRVVFCTPDGDDPIVRELAALAGARIERQSGVVDDQRLATAFTAEFERGARAVCAIGATTPTLPTFLIDHAFRALLWERIVVGPTMLRGPWLLGAQRPAPEGVLEQLVLGARTTTTTVTQRLAAQGLAPHLLPFWYDVDDLDSADVDRLVWHTRTLRAADNTTAAATWQALRDTGLVSTDLEEHRA